MNTATLAPAATPPALSQPTQTADGAAAIGLQWGVHLCTGNGAMDHTHSEFVNQLNGLLAAPVAEQVRLYQAFLDHTVTHFAQEERWMRATGFAPENCHALQHASILETMRAVAEHARQGDDEIVTRLAEALAEWFPQHAATMDAGLALHLQEVGYDCEREALSNPERLNSVAPRTGCGSAGCG